MAGWDGRYWREENGRFAKAGTSGESTATAYVSIRRTLANPRAASDSDILDVALRITMRAKRGKRDTAELEKLDAELIRRVAGGEPDLTPEQQRVDQLVAGGASWEEAYAETYGDSSSKRAAGDVDRRKGERSEKTRRRHYAEMTYLSMLQAEEWTRGNMLSKAGKAKGISPAVLFSGPRARAEKYASEELLRFWAEVTPRRTYAEFRAERTGDAGGARKARDARVQQGNGKDFG